MCSPRSGKLKEFIGNPNDFIAMVKRNLQNVLAAAVVEGLQYEKIGGYVYELRELQRTAWRSVTCSSIVFTSQEQAKDRTSTTSRSTPMVPMPLNASSPSCSTRVKT